MNVSPDRLDRRKFVRLTAGAGVLGVAGCLGASDRERTPAGETTSVEPEELTRDITQPWGMAALDGDLLVTEKVGGLKLIDREGVVDRIAGTPEVYAAGQGGLLDVAVHPAYPDEPWIYLTYAARNDAGETATHLGRGRLDREGTVLEEFERIHVAEPFVDSTGHYGSRVLFGTDGMVYMTTGDRQQKNFGPDHVSQNLTNELGATLRLEADGSVPTDNPFVDDPGAADAIFSYGHRNPQGLAVHPGTGEIWASEHGERDGDEINILQPGGNYGWPVASEACRYGTDQPVAPGHADREDVIAPVHYWECGSGGFPPAGMTFYDGEAVPAWQGELFVGNLAGGYLGQFAVDGGVTERDPLLADRGWRIRDVTVAPETGALYVAVDSPEGPIVRLRPYA